VLSTRPVGRRPTRRRAVGAASRRPGRLPPPGPGAFSRRAPSPGS
jgi:hypothetical protein